jgi:predicted glycoside hydrolase/deacetylase ChbG (UPF0249 family)/methylase of polypeptide subunit release factors
MIPHRSVIFEADDLGLLYAFNEGIRVAHQQGRLTSTCIRANGYAYEHAIREILPACPGLGVGIHLTLNDAGCVAPRDQVSLLLGTDGDFRSSYVRLMKLAQTSAGLEQIERELRAQIEKVLHDGVKVDHLNSHQHVHMIPAIFHLTCRLAREYAVPCVRLVREPPYLAGGLLKRLQPFVNSNYIKHVLLNRFARVNAPVLREFGLVTTAHFIGINYTAHMDIDTIRKGLNAVPCGSIEVLLHPTIGPDARDHSFPRTVPQSYVNAPQRAVELKALTAPALLELLQRENCMTTTFSEWAEQQQSCQVRVTTPSVPDTERQICETATVLGPLWVSAAHEDSRAFAELALSQLSPGQRALDVGTGTGIVAICLAKACRQVVATDISAAAVRNAVTNAKRNGVMFPCYQSDLLASVDGRFDLIVFNPPYNFGPDTFLTNVAKNLLRRIPWLRRGPGKAMPMRALRFHQQLIGRLIQEAPEHLTDHGRILLHAYESEVSALSDILPRGSETEILNHPALTNRNHTVGMLIRPGKS